MKIDHSIVNKLADLAKLEFDKDAKEEIIADLNKILISIEKLNEINTSNVEPLIYMSEEVNVLREDNVKHEITQQEGLKNAPKKDSDYFRVPKVIDQK